MFLVGYQKRSKPKKKSSSFSRKPGGNLKQIKYSFGRIPNLCSSCSVVYGVGMLFNLEIDSHVMN